MKEEIKQDGRTVLSSTDGRSIGMIFNNLCGRNFTGKEYENYVKHMAYESMGFKPGIIAYWRDNVLMNEARLPETSP